VLPCLSSSHTPQPCKRRCMRCLLRLRPSPSTIMRRLSKKLEADQLTSGLGESPLPLTSCCGGPAMQEKASERGGEARRQGGRQGCAGAVVAQRAATLNDTAGAAAACRRATAPSPTLWPGSKAAGQGKRLPRRPAPPHIVPKEGKDAGEAAWIGVAGGFLVQRRKVGVPVDPDGQHACRSEGGGVAGSAGSPGNNAAARLPPQLTPSLPPPPASQPLNPHTRPAAPSKPLPLQFTHPLSQGCLPPHPHPHRIIRPQHPPTPPLTVHQAVSGHAGVAAGAHHGLDGVAAGDEALRGVGGMGGARLASALRQHVRQAQRATRVCRCWVRPQAALSSLVAAPPPLPPALCSVSVWGPRSSSTKEACTAMAIPRSARRTAPQ
jgi:hypothetical protein